MPFTTLSAGGSGWPLRALLLGGCGVVLCAVACGPATPPPEAPEVQPAATAPAPERVGNVEPGSDETPETGEIPRPRVAALFQNQRPSTVALWCSAPKGPACQRAAAELQLAPLATDQVPEALLADIRDIADDCSDNQIAALARRVTDALALNWDRWHSHIGTSMVRSGLESIYQGAGCVSCCDPQEPSVKIHAAYMEDRKSFLVRVWEAGAN